MSITAYFKIGEEKFNDGVDCYVIGIVLFDITACPSSFRSSA